MNNIKNKNTDIDSFFDFPFLYRGFTESIYWKDKEDSYKLELEVPYFNKDNLNIEYHDGYIHVNGETSDKKFNKKLIVPEGADIEDINASVKDGVLYLAINKHTKKTYKIKIA